MKGFVKGDPRAIAAGQKGGRIRGQQLQVLAIRKWIARYPDVPAEAARAIYLSGYAAGTQATYQARKRAHVER